jgi:transposase
MGAAAAHNGRAHGARRSFSARARRAAFLQAHGHSRKETAAIVGVRPETISVWKRHPQWQLELQRWRKLAEAPLDKTQLRPQLEAAEATIEAVALLRLIMERATKRVRTPTGIKEEPDWRTQLRACRSSSPRGLFLSRHLPSLEATFPSPASVPDGVAAG